LYFLVKPEDLFFDLSGIATIGSAKAKHVVNIKEKVYLLYVIWLATLVHCFLPAIGQTVAGIPVV
jgi:hypothetical protein